MLSSLAAEVDTIFLKLRKADQVICQELSLLKYEPMPKSEYIQIETIDVGRFKKTIYKIPARHLLLDEYILYMLDSKTSNIFDLVEDYNNALKRREKFYKRNDCSLLKKIDEQLAHGIRRLGAMVYHLNIHLNLLTILLVKSTNSTIKNKVIINDVKDTLKKKLLDDWDKWYDNVQFIEITIDEPCAIVTWVMEELYGDALLHQERGNWQLMKISTSRFKANAFEPVNISLDAAERLLNRHYQKLERI